MNRPVVMGFLGQTALRMHGRMSVHWERPQARAVLAVLLAHAGQRIPASTLTERAWPEERRPRNPASTLHTYTTRIRAALQAAGIAARLETVDGGYQLHADKNLIDYYRLRETISDSHRHARQNDHEKVCACIEQAIALWNDLPLADVHSPWADNWRRAVLADEWLPANDLLVDSYLELGQFDMALRRLNDLHREHGFTLSGTQRRLTLMTRLGRRDDAYLHYVSTRQRLLREGDDESADALKRHYDTLAAPAPRSTAHSAGTPPSSHSRVPRQLPRDVPNLIGRDALIGRLDAITGTTAADPSPAAVLLTGPPGIGKTTVAVRWAHRSAQRFPCGTLFTDLRGFAPGIPQTPAEVVDRFLAALDPSADQRFSTGNRTEQLRALLAERPALVILDNAANSDQIEPLLNLFASCVVLITSRNSLRKASTRYHFATLALHPLPLPAATALLSARIGDRAKYEPGPVRDLARRCGGLPLALALIAEHAASRTGVPLRGLATQLRDHDELLFLEHEADTPPAGLAAAFACSYEALSPSAQRTFRALGLHPGTDIGVHAAAACTGEPVAATRRNLDALHSAHLLEQREEIDRFHLHDLVHAYAAHLCAGQDHRAARHRIASFYLHSAARAHELVFPHRPGPPLPPVAPGCEPLTYATADEAEQWCLREAETLASVLRYATQHGLDDHAWPLPHTTLFVWDRHGRYPAIRAGLEIAAAAAARCGEREAEAGTLNDLGHTLMLMGEHDHARDHLYRALDIISESDNPAFRVVVQLNVARLEHETQRLSTALDLLVRCDRLASELDDPGLEAGIAHQLGETLRAMHDRVAAQGHFERALRLREQVGDLPGQIAAHVELADLACLRDDHPAAQQHADQARTLLARSHDADARLRVLLLIARLRHEQENPDEAIQHAREAIALAYKTHNPVKHALALEILGKIYHAEGESGKACDAWTIAAGLLEGKEEHAATVRISRHLADINGAHTFVPAARDADALAADPAARINFTRK